APPTEPEPSSAADADQPPVAEGEASSDQPSTKTEEAAAEEEAPAAESAAAKDPTKEELLKKYRMTETGLTVEISGVRFLANVKPVPIGKGWGVEVAVEGAVKD